MPSFETILRSEGEEAAFFIEVPAEVVSRLGTRKRPPVQAILNGYQYRTTIATYGGRYYLPVRREVREAAGLRRGEKVIVSIVLDDDPRVVELPDAFRLALDADPVARVIYDRLSYSHRKEYVDWVLTAKRDETRQRRIEKAVAMIKEGVKEP